MKRPTLPPPAMTTRTSVPPRRIARERLVEGLDVLGLHRDVQQVALLADRRGTREERRPEPPDGDDTGADRRLELAEQLTGPGVGKGSLDQTQLRRRVGPLRRRALRKQSAEHAVGRPRDRGDRGKAEP